MPLSGGSDGRGKSGDVEVVHVVEKARPAPIYLGDRKLLARTVWGGSLVVPSFNVDVAIGVARDGVIEPWTTRLVQELVREGDTVVNVGANFGYYTVLSAYCAGHRGRVISVEANPHIIPYLVNSIYWSGVPDRVMVFHCAAWHESGPTLDFLFSPAFLGGGSASELWAELPSLPKLDSLDAAIWDHKLASAAADSDGRVHFVRDFVVPFQARARKIDDICTAIDVAHLLHMDIEGAEAFAIQGARDLISRSPDLRITFEWSSHRYRMGSQSARTAFEAQWAMLVDHGFKVRKLEPKVAEDGGIFLSAPVTFEHMRDESDGDYVAVRPHNDPWG